MYAIRSYYEQSALEKDGLEEERRLAYVAITRARERLYLSFAQTRMLHGQTRYNLPSRFFEEIPRITSYNVCYTKLLRDRDVGKASLLLESVPLERALLVRKQPFLEAREKYGVEFQPLGRMYGHQLQRVLPFAGLVLARLERGVRQERRQGVDRGRVRLPLARLEPGGIAQIDLILDLPHLLGDLDERNNFV